MHFSRKPFFCSVHFLESEFALCTLIVVVVSQLCFLKLIEVILKTLDLCVDFLCLYFCQYYTVALKKKKKSICDGDIKQTSEFSFDGRKIIPAFLVSTFYNVWETKKIKMEGSILHFLYCFVQVWRQILFLMYSFLCDCISISEDYYNIFFLVAGESLFYIHTFKQYFMHNENIFFSFISTRNNHCQPYS